mgnify:CR=1 FL=1
MGPKLISNDPKMIPKWFQHDPQMVPKWSPEWKVNKKNMKIKLFGHSLKTRAYGTVPVR